MGARGVDAGLAGLGVGAGFCNPVQPGEHVSIEKSACTIQSYLALGRNGFLGFLTAQLHRVSLGLGSHGERGYRKGE